ncbi:MAG: hypothetical protein RLP14_07680 [Owenweeksia sp.]
MGKTITILLALLIQLTLKASNSGDNRVEGDVYINLSFIKVEEDHQTYALERLLNEIQPKVNEAFSLHGIHFVFSPSIEYLNSKEELIKDWENHTLPVFDDRLTVYIYPVENANEEGHEYGFKRVSSEIALVPVYHKAEFTQFLIKNLLYMLGLPLSVPGAKDTWASNDLAYNQVKFIADHQESKKLIAHKKQAGKTKDVYNILDENWFTGARPAISDAQALIIRKNLAQRLHLKNKLFKLPVPAFAHNGEPSMPTILEP